MSLYTMDGNQNPVLLVTEEMKGSRFVWKTDKPVTILGVVAKDGNGKLFFQQWGLLMYMQTGDYIKFDFAFV